MANADEFCQFARLGQTSKIQKCLQTHSVHINALNLYGESALSTATYYNQILSVEYLLTNKADPTLRLSAGHTAVHIACRLGNIPILHLLLSLKKSEDNSNDEEQRRRGDDKHIYDCLRMKDYSNLTPIHWAATQESVSKRQKIFRFLDQRMPGVLDSRYNTDWFNSWAKTRPWVIEQTTTININSISLVRLLPKLTNTDKVNQQYCNEGSSLPLTECIPFDMTPKTSLNGYERTPTATPIDCYDDIFEKNNRHSSKIEHHPTSLPPTPTTSRIVTSAHHFFQSEHKQLSSPKIIEHRNLPCTPKQPVIGNSTTINPQKTPYSQRLNSIVSKLSLSPLSDRSTFRAERAHVIPTFNSPPSPSAMIIKNNRGHDYEDMMTPISSKRPSHNLLLNIVPSTLTPPSSDRSSRQSTKRCASFGFETSVDRRDIVNTTTDKYTRNPEQYELESLLDDEESNQFDYLCKSASTLGLSSPGAYAYDI